MTVSSTTSKVSYSGNGSTVAFTVTFYFLASSDIKVLVRSANGTEVVKTLGTDYTVTGAGDPAGGTVTFGTAPTSGQTVVLARSVPLTQVTDYTPNDPFPAETHERALDKLTQVTQQINEAVDRSIKLSLSNTMTSTEFTVDAAERANKVFGFDAAGELVVSQELGTYRGNWTSGTAYKQRDIIKDTSNANIYICITAHTASGSQPISSNTDSAKWALIVDAASATASEAAAEAAQAAAEAAQAAAEAAQTAAELAETNAETAEANAETAETNAETAETNAEAAQAAAEAARDLTLAAYDAFDDRYLGSKSSNPTVDNDGNTLLDGALYWNTTDNEFRVYDLGATTWRKTVPSSAEQANINTVSGIAANVTTVAGISSNVTTVAGISADVTSVAGNASDISAVADIDADVSTVAGIAADISLVASDSVDIATVAADIAKVIEVANDLQEATSEIDTVANNIADVNTVGTNIADVSTVAGISADVSTVADNVTDIYNYADTYQGAKSSAPSTRNDSSALQAGDLYFNTSDNQMKVYDGAAWGSVGSTVNGTSERFRYIATAAQTTFTGADSNGNTLAYDAGFIDVYLNGVRLDQADFTATSGDSIVLASGASASDELNIVTYGNFELADVYTKSASDARYPLKSNNLSDLTSASTARTNLGLGTLATVSPTGTASSSTYLRGDGVWDELSSEPTATGSFLMSAKQSAPSGYLNTNAAHSKTTYAGLLAVVGNTLRASLVTGNFKNYIFSSVGTVRGIANNGNTWIAVGSSGEINRSTDNGSSFTSVTSGTAQTLYGVWYGGGRWVAVGGAGTVCYSTDDGATWTATTASYPISGSANTLENVKYGNSVWVAVGSAGKCIRSTDGVTWTEVEDSPSGTISALAFGEGVFVYGDDDGDIYTSTDGITRTLRVDGWGIASTDNVEEISYINGKFVAGGTNSRIIVSDDGITWGAAYQVDSTNNPLIRSITYNPNAGLYVVWTGSSTAYISQDLTNWLGSYDFGYSSSTMRAEFANGVWVTSSIDASATVAGISTITINNITSFNMDTDFYVGAPTTVSSDNWGKWYIKS